jgi:diguanylate cyclase (GGDEF)-like protein
MFIDIPDDVYQSLEKYCANTHTSWENLFTKIIDFLHGEHDPLTGAYNYRAFYEDMENLEVRLKQLPLPVTLKFLALDVSKMKEYNDLHGHPAGDVFLQSLVSDLWAKYPMSKVYRRGGDEFCVRLDSGDENIPEFNLDQPVRFTIISIEVVEWPNDPKNTLEGLVTRRFDLSLDYSHSNNQIYWKYRYPDKDDIGNSNAVNNSALQEGDPSKPTL